MERSVMMRFVYLLYFVLIIGFTTGMNSCESLPQNPADIFADGIMPKELDAIANPKLTPEQIQMILSRNMDYAFIPAVIDSGVDYTAIPENTAFDIVDGKIVGAGADILGGDSWAHPNLIDPSLYAFGSKAINQKGQIVDPVKDPLTLYDKYNTEFVHHLISRIQKSPTLRNSLFNKVNKESWTLAGTIFLMSQKYSTLDKAIENAKDIAEDEPDKLLKTDTKANDPDHKKSQRKRIKAIVEKPWIIGKTNGLPMFDNEEISLFSNLTDIEHAPEFLTVLKDVYADFISNSNFKTDFERLKKFHRARIASWEKVTKEL